jgi:hypothetical protein
VFWKIHHPPPQGTGGFQPIPFRGTNMKKGERKRRKMRKKGNKMKDQRNGE